ncbi:hypothetical protein GCM10023195_87140 [Actinoallomurus liliacearum]|uniref:CHAT domain-containing protein n=1 Tax=Actinoallomurus liliacearum TaxID=1080073 RepID=A0ABP8TYL2_9ACTN
MAELRCEVTDYDGPARWRWVLTGPGGRFLGDHEVRLDETDWQYEAFTDLRAYLLWHTAPDRRMEQETRIVAEVGAWLGEQVFGPLGAAMVRERPATVRIVVPAEARTLAFRPFELAHVDGRPLALRNVTLVTQVGTERTSPTKGVRDRLRVLGLFSLPTGHRPLNLRRERQALSRLFQEIAAVHGRAVDVRVLQYGATRERLREILEEDEGWDIVHISGHGEPGELLLEHADGSADPIDAADLTDLLDLARERLSLVSLSSCWSAALTAAEQLRLLKLTPPPALADERSTGTAAPDRPTAALATELADRLDCAVLAMRYPIIDDFAIDLAEKLYGLLAEKAQPLPRALGTALRQVVRDPPTPACPPLSVATPALFGAHAVDLRLAAPRRTESESYAPWRLKLAGFPAQPERFVGRVGVMARSSSALAPRSGSSGVLLHGMPGAGKTACALELAYTHEDVFERLVWFKAPDEGRDITDALTRFAIQLESALPELKFAHLVDDADRLDPFLPRLTELAERRRLLIVADNVESLLTGSGEWRDPRWRAVVAALTDHSGLSRLVLTSRRLPEGLDRRIGVEPIDALPLDEALLLARELPALNRLLEGTVEGIEADAARRLAARVVEAAQGHPKLLELAEGQASDPNRLRDLVTTAGDAWRETSVLPERFFTTGAADATGDDYLHALGAWTRSLIGGLAPAERDAFFFLCCLEEDDRIDPVLESTWDLLWADLGRPARRRCPGRSLGTMTGSPWRTRSDAYSRVHAIPRWRRTSGTRSTVPWWSLCCTISASTYRRTNEQRPDRRAGRRRRHRGVASRAGAAGRPGGRRLAAGDGAARRRGRGGRPWAGRAGSGRHSGGARPYGAGAPRRGRRRDPRPRRAGHRHPARGAGALRPRHARRGRAGAAGVPDRYPPRTRSREGLDVQAAHQAARRLLRRQAAQSALRGISQTLTPDPIGSSEPVRFSTNAGRVRI